MRRFNRADHRRSGRGDTAPRGGRLPYLLMLLLVSAPLLSAAASRVDLGANVNEHLCSLQVPLLERSHTTWVRGMVPFGEFFGGSRSLTTDQAIGALKASVDAGRKAVLTLKWDLKENRWRVPTRGSDTEKQWISWADQVLDGMSGRISILVVTNEVVVDTMRIDLQPSIGGSIPFLDFLQDLVAHIQARKLRAADGGPLPIYLGGFTRLHEPDMQSSPGVNAILTWAQSSPQVDGVDVHLHTRSLSEMAAALRFVRSKIPNKPLIVTEFSNVWTYKEHLQDTLGADARGQQFAQRYGLNAGTSVFDYINSALADPVPEEQWQAFLASRDWFDPLLVSKATALMGEYGVKLATYAFSEGKRCSDREGPRRHRLRPGKPPWLLNPLFVGRVARAKEPSAEPVNYGVFDDYVRLQGGVAGKSAPVVKPSAAARRPLSRQAGASPAPQHRGVSTPPAP